MARVNIYLPDDLAEAIRHANQELNVSQICSAALRDALFAQHTIREPYRLLDKIVTTSAPVGWDLAQACDLRYVIAGGEPPSDQEGAGDPAWLRAAVSDGRETVAHLTATFIERVLFTEMKVAIGGGAQMWSAIRRLSPRALRLGISAIGIGHVDARMPHVHANMLVTMLSLLYAPRSHALLVGAPTFASMWSLAEPSGDNPFGENPARLIVGSCSRFDPRSAYAEVLGKEITDFLVEERVMGEFLGVFFTEDGRRVEPYVPGSTVSHISAADLRGHANRSDTFVVLSASGAGKLDVIWRVLEEALCNVLITDEPTAAALLERSESSRGKTP